MLSGKWLEFLRTGLLITEECCSQAVLQLLFFSMKGRYCGALLARIGSCCCVLTQWYNKQEGRHLKSLMILISFIKFLLPHLKPQSLLFFMDWCCFFLSNFPQLPGHLKKNKTHWRHKYIFLIESYTKGGLLLLKESLSSFKLIKNFWAFSVMEI